MFHSSNKNKAKLEHKLYLARENPEPVFDLSDCGLKNVPSGVYSLCRVFLKESLRLEQNFLSSLKGGGVLKDLHQLKILNLGHNNFTTIPDDINVLVNLLELYLNDNKIQKLPVSLCHIRRLTVLDVSNNKLKLLPDNLGDLKNLQILNLKGNNLNHLPKSVCAAQRLVSLEVDHKGFIYPPSKVMEKDADFVIKYICEDVGYPYNPEKSELSPDTPQKTSPQDDDYQTKFWNLKAVKEQKLKDFLEIERLNEVMQKEEFALANASKIQKEKLLADIMQQQTKLDSKLALIHKERDIERFHLIEQLQEAEQNTCTAIRQLLTVNYAPMAQLLEQEKKEEEKLLRLANKQCEISSRSEILTDMQTLLEQETEKFKLLHDIRMKTAKDVLKQELKSDNELLEYLTDQNLRRTELVSKLQTDEELQRTAVGALLERGDARSWGLVQQVKLVESQLAALTVIEIDRKKLEMDEHLSDLAEKRVNLSMLLMDLLEQQNCRRTQLLSTLQMMEENKDATEDFWLRQYQGLLQRLPHGLSLAQKNIDSELAQSLLLAGVVHCLPFLAKLLQQSDKLRDVTDMDLFSAGIVQTEDRKRILEVFRDYDNECRPSAPPMEAEASAPIAETSTELMNECVVCMDRECSVVFIPCGHLCCCGDCSGEMEGCPMCRARVEHKIKVISV